VGLGPPYKIVSPGRTRVKATGFIPISSRAPAKRALV
jgi:hypothetical protein